MGTVSLACSRDAQIFTFFFLLCGIGVPCEQEELTFFWSSSKHKFSCICLCSFFFLL